MDEQSSDPQARNSNGEMNTRQRSSVVSLDRMSDHQERSLSLNQKHSFVEVMDLEGNDRNDDIYNYFHFQERRLEMIRNSNNSRSTSSNIEDSSNGDQQIQNQSERRCIRRSSNSRLIHHECKCEDDNCFLFHCPCIDASNQMCLLGSCCLNCIKKKNEMLQAAVFFSKGCSCKRNRCFGSQCKCFQLKRKCEDQICNCSGCQNVSEMDQKNKSKTGNRNRKGKGSQNAHKNSKSTQVSCSCKKTHCMKKYCICYANGKDCGSNCICDECHNHYEDDDDREEKDIERQRYGRIHEENEQIDIDQYFQEKNYDNEQLPMNMQFDHPDFKLSYHN